MQNYKEVRLELDLNKVLHCEYEGEIIYEEFRDIPKYEKCYKVSNFGRVKSLKRKDTIGRLVTEKILKQGYTPNGWYINLLSGTGL